MKLLQIGPRAAAVAAAAVTALILAAPADAARGRELKAAGQVLEVVPPPPAGGNAAIIIHTRGGNVRFLVTPTTQIEVEGEEGSLDRVLAGDLALVKYVITVAGAAPEFTAAKIETQRPRDAIFGVVKNAVRSEAGGPIDVTVDPLVGEDKVLKVVAGSEIWVQGRGKLKNPLDATGEQLNNAKGLYVAATFLVGTHEIDTARFSSMRRLPFKGEVVGIEPSANIVVVGYEDQQLAFEVVPGSTIMRLDGKAIPDLSPLTVGDRVEGLFVMALDQTNPAEPKVRNVVTHLVARTPRPVSFVGQITAKTDAATVSATGEPATPYGALLVTLRSGEVVTLQVDSNCKIRVGGKGEASTWADLAVGQKCSGQYRARGEVNTLLKIQARKLGTGGGE
jgi:hypothetical protein